MESPIINNIPQVLFDRVGRMRDLTAVMYRDHAQNYQQASWEDLTNLVTDIAFGLLDAGLKPQEPVAIYAPNSYKWIACDVGILSVGGFSVPLYPTSSTLDVGYILNNSESCIAFVQGTQQVERLLASKSPHLRKIIILDGAPPEDAELPGLDKSACITFDDLLAAGRKLKHQSPDLLTARRQLIKSDDLATVIYTSGTTGTPKGAMITHGNILSVLGDIGAAIPIGQNDIYLSYLPLSHVFERVAGEFYWLYSGSIFALAQSVETFATSFNEVKPSMILVVPRVLDRIYARVQQGIKSAPIVNRKLIEWAVGVGSELLDVKASRKTANFWLKIRYFLAQHLALKKLRHKIAPRLKLIVSGGAPATAEVIRFFNAIGICTLEGYGLTETSAPVTANLPDMVRIGTVGTALRSVELRLADDGEVLVRGPSVSNGYYKNEAETHSTFANGWFYTGDIGAMDADGHLRIIDRKKDIIVNAAGKNVAPQKVENMLREIPIVSNAVVFGDKRTHLVALLVLNETATMELAKENGWLFATWSQLRGSDHLARYLRSQINDQSRHLADHERVRHFTILPHDLSVEAGELTATLKVKRTVVAERYRELIEAFDKEESLVTSGAR